MQRAIPEIDATAGREGGRLLRLLRDERCEGYEKSFKLAQGELLDRRVLLGIPRAGTRPEALLAACEGLAMPARYLEAFRRDLPGADTVHFGFEESGSGLLYKAYLEFAGRLGGDAPTLLHLAYKWDANDPSRHAVARYTCHPGLPIEAILRRLEQMSPGIFDMLRLIVELAAARATEPLMYLEVEEEGNPRFSCDINLHAAGLRLQEIEPQLRELQRRFAIPAGRFERLWGALRGEKLGHISAGLSREAQPFLTVYHEVSAR